MDVRSSSHSASGSIVRWAVSFALVAVLAFFVGFFVGTSNHSQIFDHIPFLGDNLDTTPDVSADLTDFWKAWNTLNSRFVGTSASTTIPNAQEKVWGAIQGLTSSYDDPYTVYLPPEEAKLFQEDILGSFSGVGMEIGIRDGILTIIAPLKNTPAERAGLHAGDMILAIDKTPTDGMSTDEAVKLIRGTRGTMVTFDILRDGERLEVSVTRDNIEVPTIEYSLDAENSIYTISLYSFTATANGLFNRALGAFRASGSDKLIVDLRGNPGGYLNAAVSLASHFLPEGEVVVTEDYEGKEENVIHTSTGTGGIPSDTKLVVLVDQGSASASEIFAGALQDHGRATLIGAQTFGKGSVQELVSIDGGALKITVARWLTPAGRSISDGGLTPDIEIVRTSEDVTAGKDPQKKRAIEFLRTGK